MGVSEHEQKQPQAISLSVTVDFDYPPLGCKTDDINDTLCYDTLIHTIRASLKQNQPFRLLEHLTHCLYADMMTTITNCHTINSITIAVTKLTPPISDLHGGVTFRYQSDAIKK